MKIVPLKVSLSQLGVDSRDSELNRITLVEVASKGPGSKLGSAGRLFLVGPSPPLYERLNQHVTSNASQMPNSDYQIELVVFDKNLIARIADNAFDIAGFI